MKNRLLGILLLIISGCMIAVAQEKNAEYCAQLAARGDVEELRPLYDSLQADLPEHTRLYCRLAFARADNHPTEVVAVIDTLEQQYAGKLDLRGLLALCDVKCEAMRQISDFEGLKLYTKQRLDWCQQRGIKQSRRKNLRFFQQLAQRFVGTPKPDTYWQERNFPLPASRDWPVLVPVGIKDQPAVPFVWESTEIFTLISEADAEHCGITPIGEPLSLPGRKGTAMARPVLVDSLVMGGLVLRNVMVFVVGNDVAAPYNRVIGRDVMRHFRQIALNDDCILFSADGDYRRDDMTSRHLPDYRPLTVSDYISRGDLFGLLRNEASLYFTATPQEIQQMTAVLDVALRSPEAASLPEWQQQALAGEHDITTARYSQCYFLVNTPNGLAYEAFDGAHYRPVLLTPENIQGATIDLPNMLIYLQR